VIAAVSITVVACLLIAAIALAWGKAGPRT
jgi:hypothetical protein